MGDVEERHPQLFLQAAQFYLHLPPQLEVQGPQGLVQEEDPGAAGQGPGDGPPLPLSPGKLRRHPFFIAGKLHQVQHLLHRLSLLLLGGFPQAEAVGDVLPHRHMGKEGVVLEHSIDVPLVGSQSGDVPPFQKDPAAVGLLQAGNDPQGGGLPTSAGAQEGDKLPLANINADPPEDLGPAEGLGDFL